GLHEPPQRGLAPARIRQRGVRRFPGQQRDGDLHLLHQDVHAAGNGGGEVMAESATVEAPQPVKAGGNRRVLVFLVAGVALVLALMLMTIGVFAVVQVFYSGLRLSVTSDSRTRASATASREIESMRAVAYNSVGMNGALISGPLYADSDGHSYSYVTGGTTV